MYYENALLFSRLKAKSQNDFETPIHCELSFVFSKVGLSQVKVQLRGAKY